MSKQRYKHRNTAKENRLFNCKLGSANISLPFAQSQGADQAWSQADAYALDSLYALQQAGEYCEQENGTSHIAIINDSYGALFAVLDAQTNLRCTSYTDEASLKFNYEHNQLPTQQIQAILTLADSVIDVAIVKIPKQLDYFELILSMLSRARNHDGGSCTIILSGMQKYLSKNYYQLIEKYLTDVQVLPGVKKAKAVIAQSNTDISLDNTFAINDFTHTIKLNDYGITLENLPNVFSRKQLDIGTRFFLDNFPHIPENANVLDLACGNGALSLYALSCEPSIMLQASDHSSLALASLNLALNDAQRKQVKLMQLNCLFDCDIAPASLDSVLCNPPFHQGHNISDHIAHTMFKQTRPLLKPGGKLYVIGNRHLKYNIELEKYYSSVKLFASNDKFSIFEAMA